MILFDKFITSEEDIPVAIKKSENSHPSIFGNWGEQALARYRQNLVESIGEKADTELIFDPFLVGTSPILERSANSHMGKRLTSWQHTTWGTRGFYTRKDPNFLTVQRCDYFNDWITQWDDENPGELEDRYAKQALEHAGAYMDKHGTGKVPKRVRLNKNFVLGLYIKWRKGGSLKAYHPLTVLQTTLDGYGTNRDIIVGLLQGETMVVDKDRFRKAPATHQLPLCDYRGSRADSPFVPGTFLEIIFEKVRSDADAERLLFQGRTHIGKFIRWPSRTGTLLHEIRGVEKDGENEVMFILDPNTIGAENQMYLGTDREKPITLPRYVRCGFAMRAPKGTKNWNHIREYKGPDAVKAAMTIREIRAEGVIGSPLRVQLLARTKRRGGIYIFLDEGYESVRSIKGGYAFPNIEEQWQKYLGRRKHPPQPAKKPAKPEAKHPFGEPDEVFARTPAQAREALRPRDPDVADPMGYVVDEVIDRAEVPRPRRPLPAGFTFATTPPPEPNPFAREFMATFANVAPPPPTGTATPTGGITLETLQHARDIMMRGHAAQMVHDAVVWNEPNNPPDHRPTP